MLISKARGVHRCLSPDECDKVEDLSEAHEPVVVRRISGLHVAQDHHRLDVVAVAICNCHYKNYLMLL